MKDLVKRFKVGCELINVYPWPGQAHIVQEAFAWKRLEDLPHPAYSLDLSPCALHLFELLKKALKEHQFHSESEMKWGLNGSTSNQSPFLQMTFKVSSSSWMSI